MPCPWSNGTSEDQYIVDFVVLGSNPVWSSIFSKKILIMGYFCISKCPGSAVAKVELMIYSHMINRVKKVGNITLEHGKLSKTRKIKIKSW